MSTEDLVSTLQELAGALQADHGLGVALARIAEAATTSVAGCDAASVALSLEGRAATMAASARIALEIDLVQYDTGQGPCLRALDDRRLVRLNLIEIDEAFPHFAVGAAHLGVQGVLSVPVLVKGEVIATLNLYSRTGTFASEVEVPAQVLAAEIAVAITASDPLPMAQELVDRAQQHADESAQVAIATGLLMGAEECTAEQAEGLLRNAATQDHETILAIARRILDDHRRTTRPG